MHNIHNILHLPDNNLSLAEPQKTVPTIYQHHPATFPTFSQPDIANYACTAECG